MKNRSICTLILLPLLLHSGALAQVFETKITASDAAAGDRFGISVSIDNNRAIVGAWGNGVNGVNSGSAYIYKWSGSSWVEEANIVPSDGAERDFFGNSVSIDSDWAIIGASNDDDKGEESGSAYIYKWNGTAWVQETKLTASDGAAGDQFSIDVSIKNDRAIIGAKGDDDNGESTGAAYIYEWNGTAWVEETKITASDGAANDQFGSSVSIDSNRAIIGAPVGTDSGVNSGVAYVYTRNITAWVEEAKLVPSDGADVDYFGFEVSIENDRVIIGAPFDDDNGGESGSAYIFKWNGTAWVEEGKLIASYGAANDQFGLDVSINSDRAISGTPYTDSGTGSHSGAASIYKWNGTAWVEEAKLTASDAALGDWFSYTVSMASDRVIVGAYGNDDDGSISGSAYIYEIQFPLSEYSTSSLAFSNVHHGEQSQQTFSVQNMGIADLIVSGMSFTVDNYSASPATFTLSSGQSQQVTVTFAPDSAKIYDGDIVITHNGTTSPDSILVTGRGIAPVLSITQDSLLFGEVQIGEQTELVISIQNDGDAVLNIDSIYASISNFEPVDTVLMINPGSVGSITVLFAPTEIRPYFENLVLRSNVLGNPDTVLLRGTGVEPHPEILLSDNAMAFPATDLNQQSSRSFTVTNTGFDNLSVTHIQMTSADFTADSISFNLSPGQAQTVSVTFRPQLTGDYSELAILIHDGPSSPDTLTLSATGLLPGASMNFLAQFTVLPSYVNILFQTTDGSGAGLTTLSDVTLYDILENGSAISETEALPNIGQMDQVPFKIKTVLMLDNSFSIGLNLGTLKTAALAVINNKLPNQEIAVLTFSETIVLLQDFSHDVDSLEAAINSIGLGPSSTNLYGAVIAGADHAQDVFSPEQIEQSYLIILTDGQDTQGSSTLAEALVASSTKQVITIGVGAAADVDVLQQIQTAGYYNAVDFNVLLQVFEDIQQHIIGLANSFYWLVYVSPTRGTNEHTLEIGLKNNPNTNANATISVNFSSNGFYSVLPGVYVNRSFDELSGIDSVTFEADSASILLSAETIFGLLVPVYEWASGDTNIITVIPVAGDHTRAIATQIGQFGQSTLLTVSDVANNFSKDLYSVVSKHGSPPLAIADSGTTSEDTALTIFVLLNDADPEGFNLTVVSVSQPAHGTAAIDAGDTTLTYVPNLNFTGTDSFTYMVSDGFDGLDTAVVWVTVISVNDPPEPFALIVPADGDTAEIENDSLNFVWESSSDIEGDNLTYQFRIYGAGYDSTITGLADTALVLTGMAELALDSVYTWSVYALDGTDTTSSISDFRFRMPSVLALDPLASIPEAYALHQNYPNPFNPSTTIPFDLPRAANISIVVYDLLGREVARLVDKRLVAGYHLVTWDGKTDQGRYVSTGLYVVFLQGPEFTRSVKIVMLK